MKERKRLWLTHRRRLDTASCPLCGVAILWIYDGICWYPCNREPVLAYPERGGKRAVYKRCLLENVHLYSDGSLKGLQPVEMHLPHVLSCEVLRAEKQRVLNMT